MKYTAEVVWLTKPRKKYGNWNYPKIFSSLDDIMDYTRKWWDQVLDFGELTTIDVDADKFECLAMHDADESCISISALLPPGKRKPMFLVVKEISDEQQVAERREETRERSVPGEPTFALSAEGLDGSDAYGAIPEGEGEPDSELS